MKLGNNYSQYLQGAPDRALAHAHSVRCDTLVVEWVLRMSFNTKPAVYNLVVMPDSKWAACVRSGIWQYETGK
jgi:hypothetical protein